LENISATKGKDAVVVYDDLSKHAWAYRANFFAFAQTTGKRGISWRCVYLHLVFWKERPNFLRQKEAAVLQALPIIETQLGDVTAYIPTNVISITDGQIYLESDLFFQGMRPAVNVGFVGFARGFFGANQSHEKVAGKLRLELAQFRELQHSFSLLRTLMKQPKKRINKGRLTNEIFKAVRLSSVSFEKQVLVLYAGLERLFFRVQA